jgi:hypothetical protein
MQLFIPYLEQRALFRKTQMKETAARLFTDLAQQVRRHGWKGFEKFVRRPELFVGSDPFPGTPQFRFGSSGGKLECLVPSFDLDALGRIVTLS